jgi:hypothetical protein
METNTKIEKQTTYSYSLSLDLSFDAHMDRSTIRQTKVTMYLDPLLEINIIGFCSYLNQSIVSPIQYFDSNMNKIQ